MKKMIRLILIFGILSLVIFSQAQAEQTIDFKEFGISLKIPSSIEWTTRTDGDFEALRKVYDLDREGIVGLMTLGKEYLLGVDPDGELNLSLSIRPHEGSKTSFSYYPDDYLLNMTREISPNIIVKETFIHQTNEAKYICSLLDTTIGNKTENEYRCETSVNGNYYVISVRGLNSSYIETMALYLMNNAVFDKVDFDKLVKKTIDHSGISISIPDGWEDKGKIESEAIVAYSFSGHSYDGALRTISCEIIDLCEIYNYDKTMRSELDASYSEYIAYAFCNDYGIDTSEIQKYTFNGREYFSYPKLDDGFSYISMGMVDNGYSYSFVLYMPYTDMPYEDEFFPIFERIMNTISF